VLRTPAREGPGSGRDVAAALDRDSGTVSHHLSRLEEDGLVERDRDGRSIVNRLTPTAEAALAPRVGDPVEADAEPGDAEAARAGD
jgi:DNA-binding MarR family transcriptional regulator